MRVMRCGSCGQENPEGSRFCGSCGASLEPGESKESLTEQAGQTEQIEKKKRPCKWLWAALAVVALAGIVAAVLIVKNVQERRNYENYVDSAQKYLEELDYENAEDSYLKAIAVAPKEEEPYVELAQLYLGQGETEKAKAILEKGAKNVPDAKNHTSSEEGESTEGASGAGGDSQKEPGIHDLLEEIENLASYSWVVEPTIEADDINYVKSGDYAEDSENEQNLQRNSKFAFIKQGDSYGLIGQDGKMATEMEYKSVEDYFGIYLLVRKEPKYEEVIGEEWDLYFFDEDSEEIDPIEGLGIGFYPGGFFYYCDGLHNENEGMGYGYTKGDPEEAIPVQKSEFVLEISDYIGDSLANSEQDLWQEQIDKSMYAIWYQGKLVTEFVYEECGSASEGLLAVKQDGKWGYVNQQGEIVIPIEYDASWTEQYKYLRSKYEYEKTDYCYAFSEGYVPVYKDGQWALMNTEGKKVILEGTFEAIRPVQDGKCWVKKEGKWGVIQLETAGESEAADESGEK